jgi:hypothetical protein
VRTAWQRLCRFLFAAESDAWISCLRIGLALVVLAYCFSLRRDWTDIYSLETGSPVKRDLAEAILANQSRLIPNLGWLVWAGEAVGVDDQTVVSASWWLLVGSSCFLIAGLFCRASAILTAFLHLCAVKSTASLTYGLDNFVTIGLFFLAIGPLPDRLSLDSFSRKRALPNAVACGFFRRALQLQMCVIYFFGGVTKAAGPGWWDGSSLWRAMIRPPFDVISPDILISFQPLFPILGIGICLLETGYPIFMWPRVTRRWWLLAIIVMHVGIAITLGMYLFASVMIVLNLAAFGPWRSPPDMSPGQLLSTPAVESGRIG